MNKSLIPTNDNADEQDPKPDLLAKLKDQLDITDDMQPGGSHVLIHYGPTGSLLQSDITSNPPSQDHIDAVAPSILISGISSESAGKVAAAVFFMNSNRLKHKADGEQQGIEGLSA